jgi:aspartyl-tRNA(Asn)/glutamyl-tRNA(Gln) amidotransferase subunit A
VSVAELAQRLRAHELSPREAVESFLQRIAELDPEVNAYISVRPEEALAEATALERSRERGPLYGVPLALKDVIDVAGARTTAASKILAENVATRDAHVVERLKRAGAIILGKLNTHEFAYGALGTSPHFGATRNPWSLEHVCGGSSGGSGAAVAADLAAATLGTDTAGSIRIPACFCGVTGLRPSTGLVSNRGVVPVAWTFDTVGPLGRTAADCALVLETIAGHDPEDPSTLDVGVPRYSNLLAGGARGLRIGIVNALFERGIDGRVAAVVARAVEELRGLGAQVGGVEIPFLEQAGTIQQAMQFPEATAAHLRWLRTRLSDYAADVRARLLVGLFVPPTAYVTGQRARRLFYDECRRVFERFDLLAAPTMPVLPPRVGEETVELDGRPIAYRLTLIRFNSPWSLIGSPVVNLPCGFVDGLPAGLALVGRRFAEATVFRAAHAFQQATDWHDRRPGVAAASAPI